MGTHSTAPLDQWYKQIQKDNYDDIELKAYLNYLLTSLCGREHQVPRQISQSASTLRSYLVETPSEETKYIYTLGQTCKFQNLLIIYPCHNWLFMGKTIRPQIVCGTEQVLKEGRCDMLNKFAPIVCMHVCNYRCLYVCCALRCRFRVASSEWWPGITSAIEQFIQSCPSCQKLTVPHREPMLSTPLPRYPWEQVAVNLFELEQSTYLLVMDYYSRIVEVLKLTSTTSFSVIAHLKVMFARFGMPATLISDNGPHWN